MPNYIGLISWSDQGIKAYANTVDRAEAAAQLATKFGGTAVQGAEDKGGTEVLAQVSPRLTSQFLEALRHPEQEPDVHLQSEDNQTALVEVRLKFQG